MYLHESHAIQLNVFLLFLLKYSLLRKPDAVIKGGISGLRAIGSLPPGVISRGLSGRVPLVKISVYFGGLSSP